MRAHSSHDDDYQLWFRTPNFASIIRLGDKPIDTGRFIDCRQYVIRTEVPTAVATDFSTGTVLILYSEPSLNSKSKSSNQLLALASNCLFEANLRIIDPVRMCPLMSELVAMDFTRDKTNLVCLGRSSRASLDSKYINYEIAVQFFRGNQLSQIGTCAINDEITNDDVVIVQTFTVHPELFLVAFPENLTIYRMEFENQSRLALFRIRSFKPPGTSKIRT